MYKGNGLKEKEEYFELARVRVIGSQLYSRHDNVVGVTHCDFPKTLKNPSYAPVVFSKIAFPESHRQVVSSVGGTSSGFGKSSGSMVVSGKLPIYPSPNLALTFTSFLGQNVRFGDG